MQENFRGPVNFAPHFQKEFPPPFPSSSCPNLHVSFPVNLSPLCFLLSQPLSLPSLGSSSAWQQPTCESPQKRAGRQGKRPPLRFLLINHRKGLLWQVNQLLDAVFIPSKAQGSHTELWVCCSGKAANLSRSQTPSCGCTTRRGEQQPQKLTPALQKQ